MGRLEVELDVGDNEQALEQAKEFQGMQLSLNLGVDITFPHIIKVKAN